MASFLSTMQMRTCHMYIYIYIWHFLICCLVQNVPLYPRQCLLCHTTDIICCVTQQTCLRCCTANMPAVSQSRHVCCVTQQTYVLCDTADMSAMSRSRHACCVTQQIFLLCGSADMSAV